MKDLGRTIAEVDGRKGILVEPGLCHLQNAGSRN